MSPNPESTPPDPEVDESATENAPSSTAAEADAPAKTEKPGAVDSTAETAGVEVQSPDFQSFANTQTNGKPTEISRFRDIKVTVSAELGRTSIPIQQLLSLASGSILELDRNIDSPIELIAQGVPLASGEVVVVDDCFAIRIIEIYPNKQAG